MIFGQFWVTIKQSRPIVWVSNRSQTVLLLHGSHGTTFPPRKTTRYLAAINPSLPDPPLIGTCSSWSRIQKDTLQPVGGGTLSLIRTETLLTKRSMELAFHVTRPRRIATMSSPVTRLDTRCPRLRWVHSCLVFRRRRKRRLVVLAVLPAIQRGFLVILRAVVALSLGLLATFPLRPGRLLLIDLCTQSYGRPAW